MKNQRGFTVIEMCGVVIIIASLVVLLLPSVQNSRERARRAACESKLSQLGLAIHFYHESFRQYPVQLNGTDGSSVPGADNDRRLSYLVPLLPFLEQEALHDEVRRQLNEDFFTNESPSLDGYWEDEMEEYGFDGFEFEDKRSSEDVGKKQVFPRGGPEPFVEDYPAWNADLASLRCPSDPGEGRPGLGRCNYAACLGDGVLTSSSGPHREVKGTFQIDPAKSKQCDAAMRGIFVPRTITRQSDVTDGLSTTLLLGEMSTDLGDRGCATDALDRALAIETNPRLLEIALDKRRPLFWKSTASVLTDTNLAWARGMRWADGMPLYTSFQTIGPPNSPIVAIGGSDASDGLFSASSRHLGGVNVCFADGSTKYVRDTIDCGVRTAPTVYIGSDSKPGSESPFGVWGAMGTRASNELPGEY